MIVSVGRGGRAGKPPPGPAASGVIACKPGATIISVVTSLLKWARRGAAAVARAVCSGSVGSSG